MDRTKVFSKTRAVIAALAVTLTTALTAASQQIPISSLDDLQKIGNHADYPLSGHYILTADIDLSPTRGLEANDETFDGRGWRPVGKSVVYNLMSDCYNADSALWSGAFTGVFDGNWHTIRGLYVDRTIPPEKEEEWLPGDRERYVASFIYLSAGLFGVLDGATVKNLSIEADTVTVQGQYVRHTSAAGILAGFSRYSTITNVNTGGTVQGITRSVEGTLSWPYNLMVGGLVGTDTWSSISGSSSAVTAGSVLDPAASTMEVYTNNSAVGGLAGEVKFSTIGNCYAKTKIFGQGSSAGGLVGVNTGGRITESGAAATGDSFAFRAVGGLVGGNGRDSGPSCPDCNDHVIKLGTIARSYSSVNLNNSGDVNVSMGGLVGVDDDSKIEDSYSVGTMADKGKTGVMGGLVGFASRVRISYIDGIWVLGTTERSYAAVSISGGDMAKSGGLVGYMQHGGKHRRRVACD